jgi:hypothetical protein
MSTSMDQVIQIIGAVLVLVGYVLSQTGRVDGSARSYLIINLVGSGFLAVAAALGHQWGFLLLNGTWAVISAVNLVRGAVGSPDPADPGA